MNNFRWFWFFIKSRSNWILWILFLNIILLGVAYIDYEISVESVFYIVILNVGLSILFLLFTFVKEVRLSKHFYEDKEIEEIKHKDLAETPFQQQVIDYLYRHIKTPVTAMKLLIDQESDDQRKRALLFEWSRINEMLDKQLYLTRLESQHRDMYFDYISLKRMVIDEIQVTRHISQAKGIGFELDFKDEQKVYTDVKWCRMMIRQVLSNSLKYSDNSTINLSGYTIEGHVVLKIKDYGRGISQRDLPRIFDRGFTSTTDRNDTASSGMGLYLVQSVKEQLGIEVKVDSIVGKGTTFYFIFPQQNEIIERMSKVTRLSF